MSDKLRHKCGRCQTVGRDVDWQPLLGDFMHYECWLEHADEALRALAKKSGRPERIGRIIKDWRCATSPNQLDLFKDA